MAFTQLLSLNAISNRGHGGSLGFLMGCAESEQATRACVCVSDRKVHVFQVVYLRSPVKLVWAWGGFGLLQMHRAEPSLWLPGMQTQRTSVCVSSQCVLGSVLYVCVAGERWGDGGEWEWKKERNRLGNWRLLAGMPTYCEKLNCVGW